MRELIAMINERILRSCSHGLRTAKRFRICTNALCYCTSFRQHSSSISLMAAVNESGLPSGVSGLICAMSAYNAGRGSAGEAAALAVTEREGLETGLKPGMAGF